MKRNRNLASLILFVFVIALLVSCGGIGVKKGFLMTQKTFNEAVTNYLVYYEAVSPDEQKDLKENVHPKILEALDVLRKMNKAILDGIEIPEIDQKKFQELRYELYKKLPKIFEEG